MYERVRDGEMPPKSEPVLLQESKETFLAEFSSLLTHIDRQRIKNNGRAMKRRLNRYEYENSLRDLLNLPWIQIRDMLPEDGELYRYNKSGEALDVSHVQLSRYMLAADYALRQAIAVNFERPKLSVKRYYARDELSLVGNFLPRENGTLPDRLSFPVLDSHAQPDVRSGKAPKTSPETREREAVGRVSSIFSDAGGYSWGQFRVPASGRYKLRFKGYSIWVSGGGIGRWFFEGFGDEKAPVFHLPLWHRPNADEVWRDVDLSRLESTRRVPEKVDRSASLTLVSNQRNVRSKRPWLPTKSCKPMAFVSFEHELMAPTNSTSIRSQPSPGCRATLSSGWKLKGRWTKKRQPLVIN